MEENQQVPESQPGVGQAISSPDSMQPSQNKGGKKMAIAAALVIVLAAAGWFAYTVYASPTKVWKKFVSQASMPAIASQSFSFSYEDKGKAAEVSGPQDRAALAMFTNLKVSVSGTAYTNNSDISRPQGTLDLNYSFGSGNTSYSSGAKMVLKDQDIYINLGDNPFIKTMLAFLSPDQKIEWIKLNLKEIQDFAAKTGASGAPGKNFDFAQQAKEYQNIFQKHLPKLLTVDKFIDKQMLHNVQAMHYSNKLDKNEMKTMLNETFDYIFSQFVLSQQAPAEEIAEVKSLVRAATDKLIDRLEITNLETWVGTEDYQLRKIKFSSNAPSLTSLISESLDEAISSEQDEEKAIRMVLEKMSFDGQLIMEQEFYDFGKTITVTPPDNAFDILKKIKEESERVDDSIMVPPVIGPQQ